MPSHFPLARANHFEPTPFDILNFTADSEELANGITALQNLQTHHMPDLLHLAFLNLKHAGVDGCIGN